MNANEKLYDVLRVIRYQLERVNENLEKAEVKPEQRESSELLKLLMPLKIANIKELADNMRKLAKEQYVKEHSENSRAVFGWELNQIDKL